MFLAHLYCGSGGELGPLQGFGIFSESKESGKAHGRFRKLLEICKCPCDQLSINQKKIPAWVCLALGPVCLAVNISVNLGLAAPLRTAKSQVSPLTHPAAATKGAFCCMHSGTAQDMGPHLERLMSRWHLEGQWGLYAFGHSVLLRNPVVPRRPMGYPRNASMPHATWHV